MQLIRGRPGIPDTLVSSVMQVRIKNQFLGGGGRNRHFLFKEADAVLARNDSKSVQTVPYYFGQGFTLVLSRCAIAEGRNGRFLNPLISTLDRRF